MNGEPRNEFVESYGPLREDRAFDIRYWQELGPEAIFAAARELVRDYLLIREGHANEPRLQRTVESYGEVRR